MRVLYSFPHTIGSPGIGTTAREQVAGLAGLGVAVELWCTAVAGPLPAEVEVHTTLSRWGRRAPHRLIGVQRAYDLHDRLVARHLRRADPPPDVVHSWPSGCLATLEAARTLPTVACREVPSVHTETAFDLAETANRAFGIDLPATHAQHRDEAKLVRERREFDSADALLVPSAAVEDSFRARGVPARRIVRHRYGCDLARFTPLPRPAPPAGAPLTGCFVGRGEPAKGLHDALGAWVAAGLPARGGRFLVAGEVLPAYRDRIAELLVASGATELGFVTDTAALLAQADVLVLPTVSEGSALVTFEAMATGCVPLVSTAAGAPCHHGVDGLVHEPGAVDELASHLCLVDRDRPRLARLREAALARRDELGWDAAARALVDAYREAIGRAGSPPPA